VISAALVPLVAGILAVVIGIIAMGTSFKLKGSLSAAVAA
jgi:hypothetical protein